jgi:hypothetical protein
MFLKGLCHEMNNFFEGQISAFCTCAYLKVFCCLVMEKIEVKVLTCFYEIT